LFIEGMYVLHTKHLVDMSSLMDKPSLLPHVSQGRWVFKNVMAFVDNFVSLEHLSVPFK
jgi:hypothetical protein